AALEDCLPGVDKAADHGRHVGADELDLGSRRAYSFGFVDECANLRVVDRLRIDVRDAGHQTTTATSNSERVSCSELNRFHDCIQRWVRSYISRVYFSKTMRSPGPNRRTSTNSSRSDGSSRV